MNNTILNIYLNLTNNIPTVNTLLICNKDTSIENIRAFLYRAILCEKPILFVISNIECLELSNIKNVINDLKILYKTKKNKKINSYLIILYEKVESGFARFLERLIPDKNILNNSYLKLPDQKGYLFNNIKLYSADFSGYGKTTEIKNEVKNKKGNYYYLPIGGTLTRDFIINNLEKLKINLKNGNKNYLHLDLSETDNEDLMSEILFKLLILRSVDSKRKIFYLGYDINILIEIPKGFYKFNDKYKLLNRFENIHITKLRPLRLEENIKYIKDSPISIVAEVLDLYDKNKIDTENIDLNAEIRKSAEECERIINKHFQAENKNYYQKMNFIKILSVQFRKFTENCYLNYDIVKGEILEILIVEIRKSVIYNFIELTKVFTKSPFDSILLNKDDNLTREEEIWTMANEKNKKEIFSFEKIKPSLVFFNIDGGSLSIISNNDKTEKNYKDLKLLWNSGNEKLRTLEQEELVETLNFRKEENLNDLIDYKKLTHEEFLKQIKILFDLEKKPIDLNSICEKLGNYVFVSDNFIKMVRILLNIEAKIPVILMGETGVGKTKLLEMLATLYGKGEPKWFKLQIHAGITDQKIIEFLEDTTKKYEKYLQKKPNSNEKFWIFFDEINTCNSLGLITEIMCNHTYLGKKINDNFIFLGACNPYREIKKEIRDGGLVYYNLNDKNKLNNLVYTVNPLPHSLLNFIFDFGSLQKEDEIKYITNAVIDILNRLKKNKIIENIEKNDFETIKKEMISSIVICHDFMRAKYDRSSVSLREIGRFGKFFEYFIQNFKQENNIYKCLKYSLNMTLYISYYLRLSDKIVRDELSNKLDIIFKDFRNIPEKEVNSIINEMTIEKERGIALNRSLKENLFTCLICIDNLVPLIIIGKPGTGKSLSFQILYDTLKGENSKERFKDKGKLYRYYYQGSSTSTSEGIEQVFEKALKAKKESIEKNNNIITLVFFDEMGLAERSPNNPLKIIHFLLEKEKDEQVPFLGISNWKLDAAKINRAITLCITDYCIEDLEDTAKAIAEALDKDIATRNSDYFETLAKTYHEYLNLIKKYIKENKDFHGNRDFYNLIKTVTRELIKRKEELNNDKKKVLTEVGLYSLEQNFSGLEDSSSKIKDIFKEKYKYNYDPSVENDKPFSVLDAIKRNISDPDTRYLMLISEGNDGRDIVKHLLNSENKKYYEIIGSKYKSDIISGRYSEEILNNIRYIMETDSVLILKDLDMIYASLYDLFNQNFTLMCGKRFARIAFQYTKISSEVNKDFHIIILVNKTQIQNLKLDPPFLNRFEKHIINIDAILDKRDLEIAKKIKDFIDLIASFNNNCNLKIDLDYLLINCKLYNIEGLIYKIKNTKISIEENEKYNWMEKQGLEYEENLIKEVFKVIVPTFCQDLIVSMMVSGVKPRNYIDMVLNIYNDSNYYNFVSFLQNIKKRKNIIYTFTKITQDIIKGKYWKDNAEIKNKYTIFNKQSTEIEMMESIKNESDLGITIQKFSEQEDKNLLILRFSEKDLDKINSVHFVINNLEKKYPKLKEKFIILIIHRQRLLKNEKRIINEETELISFFNDDYYQIFIDNLHRKENLPILELIQNSNDIVAKQYIYNFNFIENQIFKIINYLDYNILFQTENLNFKNYTSKITETIINGIFLQNQIIASLKNQAKTIKSTVRDVFLSEKIEINDIDFLEVINTNLSKDFSNCLLKIIYSSLKDNILNPFIINQDIHKLLKNDYFHNLIVSYFENSGNVRKYKLNININANKIKIYNGLKIPKSFDHLNDLVNYFDKIKERFMKNEDSLREIIKSDEEMATKIITYNKNLKKYHDNLRIQMLSNDFFKEIYNIEYNEIIKEDYLIYYVIKYIEKKELDYKYNKKLVQFLKLLISIKLKICEEEKNINNIIDPVNEFITILLFTQGYKNDIKQIFDRYLDVIKFCDNFEEIIQAYLEEKKIKYEDSQRCKKCTKIVNISLFTIIESFIRAFLLFSKSLIRKDKNEFLKLNSIFPLIESSFQQINKKYKLFSKEIYNIRNLIKIEEAYKNNYLQFEENYENIIDNLLLQSTLFYCDDYNNLYKTVIELINIFDKTFTEKNNAYSDLLFYIFRQEHKNIYIENIRTQLLEKFFNNKLLLKHSKIFLFETLKNYKPEFIAQKTNNTNLFVIGKMQNIANTLNKIDSKEFKEILLYFFEGLCQVNYFSILKKYNNEYTQECCNEILLGKNLEYLKRSIQYLNLNNDTSDNNLFKLYAIAYYKTYYYFYVEIFVKYFDKCKSTEINNSLCEKEKINEKITNIRNIYISRLYYKKFDDFEQFKNYIFDTKNLPILDEIVEKLRKESINEGYIFNESFISPESNKNYQILLQEINDENFNFDLINNNLDAFYCALVNKILSFKFGKNKTVINIKMKNIFDKTKNGINFGFKRNILYIYLLDNYQFENNIVKKISDEPLNLNNLEILLYSLRFVFNIKENDNNFYYNLLKEKSNEFIKQNYIPGSFQIINEFIRSYLDLKIKFKDRTDVGYYICKNCGFLYEVKTCTFPTEITKCINGHKIGGNDHVCYKKDLRVFYDEADYIRLKEMWMFPEHQPWLNSFEPLMNLQEFKDKYVDKKIQIEKGIPKDYESKFFENLDFVRKMDIITFRLLNFILYSFLMGSYILKGISEEEIKSYYIGEYKHNIFAIIKKNWELLELSLKEKGIENVPIFMNMIFNKIIEMINNVDKIRTKEKLISFENEVNEYIMKIISKKENVEKITQDYKILNQELKKANPLSIIEIIKSNFDPLIYNQNDYPDIQYYSISSLQNLETFINKFNSSQKNSEKYFLINLLVQKNHEMTKDIINLKSLDIFNKLGNLLLNMFSYKISREEAKTLKLKDKISDITDYYNKIYQKRISEKEFEESYIIPFLKYWDQIKHKAIQYKCQILVNEKVEGKPFDMDKNTPLSYFLIDNGELDGGIFLASAYDNFIELQNKIINFIIEKNRDNGILNSFIPQLEKEISIQDAKLEDIIYIDDNTYSYLEELIAKCSMRNIFNKDGKIDYSNYYDNIYDYDYIEIELAKIILGGRKKFIKDKLNFIIYKYEEFRGNNSSILIEYNDKYPKKELSEEEKNLLDDILKNNPDSKIYQDISSSLQIIMKQIMIDNYEQNKLIYDIIQNFPTYIILNEELKGILRTEFESRHKTFSINSLISIYEYIENLCWIEIKENIPKRYKDELNAIDKQNILDYFEKNEDDEYKIINKKIFTTALRRLISRYLASSRDEIIINPDLNLSLYIVKDELWSKEVLEKAQFSKEILDICKGEIKIRNSYSLYQILGGDKILNKELGINIEEENQNKIENDDEEKNVEVKNNENYDYIRDEL